MPFRALFPGSKKTETQISEEVSMPDVSNSQINYDIGTRRCFFTNDEHQCQHARKTIPSAGYWNKALANRICDVSYSSASGL